MLNPELMLGCFQHYQQYVAHLEVKTLLYYDFPKSDNGIRFLSSIHKVIILDCWESSLIQQLSSNFTHAGLTLHFIRNI